MSSFIFLTIALIYSWNSIFTCGTETFWCDKINTRLNSLALLNKILNELISIVSIFSKLLKYKNQIISWKINNLKIPLLLFFVLLQKQKYIFIITIEVQLSIEEFD